jgi:uncharacterized protein (TIGR02118 family)
MSYLYLLEIHSNDDNSIMSTEDILKLESSFKELPDLANLFSFTQADGGYDPVLKDEHPPLLVFAAMFNDKDALHLALSSAEFKNACELLIALSVTGLRALQEAMLFEPFLSSETSAGKANISYLVNYQGPAENEIEFLQYYRDHHPAILMQFPDIRRVELGTPIEWSASNDIERANRMLYCEVSFDSIDKLNNALGSEKRIELRKDYDYFPPFSGAVTHFPMHRKVIV